MALRLFGRQQPRNPPVPYGAGMGPSYTAPSETERPQWAPAWNNFSPSYRNPVANQPLLPVETVQQENDNYFTHPDATRPTFSYPRWTNSTLALSYANEHEGPGRQLEVQTNAGRAPDPRWEPVPVGRLQRTPQDYSFLRPFDVEMGKRNFSGVHFSMADHKRMNTSSQIFGLQPTRNARNTYRIAPPPMDVNIVDLPSYGTTPPVQQAEYTSPASTPNMKGFRL